MHFIKNNNLSIGLNPTGGELNSIVRQSDQKELLWQGDPNYWNGQAPVLFPVVGELKDEQYSHQGKNYQMKRHGFARRNDNYEVQQISEQEIKFTLRSSPATKAMYPFDFEFTTSYKLDEKAIVVTHAVTNKGEDPMFFALGGHPAFNCPLYESESYEDYFLECRGAQTHQSHKLSDQGLLTDETKTSITDQKIWLHKDLFNEDALVFKNIKCDEIILTHKEKGAILSLEPKDFPDLGIWAKPGAPFICIEPWLGYADTTTASGVLKEKEGIREMAAGQSKDYSYIIRML